MREESIPPEYRNWYYVDREELVLRCKMTDKENPTTLCQSYFELQRTGTNCNFIGTSRHSHPEELDGVELHSTYARKGNTKNSGKGVKKSEYVAKNQNQVTLSQVDNIIHFLELQTTI